VKSLKRDFGFTVVELLANIAATAVLCFLLASAYRTHQVRAQIAGTLSAVAAIQATIERTFRDSGEPPADAAKIPAVQAIPYVDSVTIVDGRLDVRFGKEADRAITGRILPLTPFETTERDIVWMCGNHIPGLGLKPLGFADGGRQATQTASTVPPRFLPQDCK
jgi:hypothetical protein